MKLGLCLFGLTLLAYVSCESIVDSFDSLDTALWEASACSGCTFLSGSMYVVSSGVLRSQTTYSNLLSLQTDLVRNGGSCYGHGVILSTSASETYSAMTTVLSNKIGFQWACSARYIYAQSNSVSDSCYSNNNYAVTISWSDTEISHTTDPCGALTISGVLCFRPCIIICFEYNLTHI